MSEAGPGGGAKAPAKGTGALVSTANAGGGRLDRLAPHLYRLQTSFKP